MQFQVPQFTDIEDKIIGPFTLKQFLYLLVAGVILFILFKLLKFIIFIILTGPIIAITLAFAFYRPNNQPFIGLVKNFLGFLKKPDFYVWRKPKIINPVEEKKIPDIIHKAPAEEKIKTESKERLQEMNWRIQIEK